MHKNADLSATEAERSSGFVGDRNDAPSPGYPTDK